MSVDATLKPRHPALELLTRYRAVLGAAWEHRAELAGPKRLADEAAFLPAALSLQDTPVHPAPRRMAYLITGLFVIALAWSILGKVDIVAVAQGRIVVSERTKLVQPLQNSVVKRVLVKDGDLVQEGQPLVELDPTVATADKQIVQDQLRSALSESARVRTLLHLLETQDVSPARASQLLATRLNAEPSAWSPADKASIQAQLEAEWADITAKLAKLRSESGRRQAELATVREVVAKLETTVPLARRREDDFRKLADQGFVAGHAGQDRTRERIELERDWATQRAKLVEMQAALAESENGRAAYLAEVRRNLREREAQTELKRQQATQEQAKAVQREKLTVLTAPVAGVVQQLAVHTPGGVVTEAQALMVIVPAEASVTAEVVLDNKDVGFAEVGQRAEIKLETFPFTRYGTVQATVQRVAADAVNDEKRGAIFPSTLTLHQSTIAVEGKSVRLAPGMNVTAEIRTGERRVIEYLLSPIQRASSESLKER